MEELPKMGDVGRVRRMLESMFNRNMVVLRDVEEYSGKKENESKFDRAYNWVFGYGAGMPFSFNYVCRSIGYSPDSVRNIVTGYLKMKENSKKDNKRTGKVLEEVA
jgi:hypothetical protein